MFFLKSNINININKEKSFGNYVANPASQARANNIDTSPLEGSLPWVTD
jgi:hypothetical protein